MVKGVRISWRFLIEKQCVTAKGNSGRVGVVAKEWENNKREG